MTESRDRIKQHWVTESVQTAKVPLTSSKGADHSPSEEALIQKEENGAFHLSLWFLGWGEGVKQGSSNPHRHPWRCCSWSDSWTPWFWRLLSQSPGVCRIFSTSSSKAHWTPSRVFALASDNSTIWVKKGQEREKHSKETCKVKKKKKKTFKDYL